MKTLYLLRHAKSDWSDPSLADHDRPLNGRGRKARLVMAGHVEGWDVDLVVSSTAARARATAEPLVTTLGCELRLDPAIYDASASELLAVVRALPDDARSVLLVGHNPGFEDLTELLAGSSPPYPTAALGTLELAIDRWAEAEPGTGTLEGHVTPADLGGPHG
jgi:phosphohistidine phosphatase